MSESCLKSLATGLFVQHRIRPATKAISQRLTDPLWWKFTGPLPKRNNVESVLMPWRIMKTVYNDGDLNIAVNPCYWYEDKGVHTNWQDNLKRLKSNVNV